MNDWGIHDRSARITITLTTTVQAGKYWGCMTDRSYSN
jgi:hypothetical protein